VTAPRSSVRGIASGEAHRAVNEPVQVVGTRAMSCGTNAGSQRSAGTVVVRCTSRFDSGSARPRPGKEGRNPGRVVAGSGRHHEQFLLAHAFPGTFPERRGGRPHTLPLTAPSRISSRADSPGSVGGGEPPPPPLDSTPRHARQGRTSTSCRGRTRWSMSSRTAGITERAWPLIATNALPTMDARSGPSPGLGTSWSTAGRRYTRAVYREVYVAGEATGRRLVYLGRERRRPRSAP
jgi:hypothetical protein